jgi:hypothetical protein
VSVVGLKMTDFGLGKHVEVVPPEDLGKFLLALWAVYYIFDAGTALVKTSALFFYARVFNLAEPRFRYALWTVHALNAAWFIGTISAAIFQCHPTQKAWKPEVPGTCDNTNTLWLWSGLSSLLIDVIILVLPLPMLYRLIIKPSRKYLIMGVFVCGYL